MHIIPCSRKNTTIYNIHDNQLFTADGKLWYIVHMNDFDGKYRSQILLVLHTDLTWKFNTLFKKKDNW